MPKNLTATIVAPQMNGRNRSGERALLGCISVIARIPDGCAKSYEESGLREVVTVRYWGAKSGNGASNDASIWVHMADNQGMCAGYGKATGWGYHRPSAALDSAIEAAGIKLSAPIDGVGDDAMRDACEAIAEAAGYSRPFLVITHG